MVWGWILLFIYLFYLFILIMYSDASSMSQLKDHRLKAWMRGTLVRLVAIDYRSLALFRVALALLLLYDTYVRFCERDAFLSVSLQCVPKIVAIDLEILLYRTRTQECTPVLT